MQLMIVNNKISEKHSFKKVNLNMRIGELI